MADYTTKKPTGLQVERSGNDFTFSWKIRDTDHKGGQVFQYRKSEKDKWHKVSVTTTQTSVTVTIDVTIINFLSFRVKGKRKKYTESYTDENGKKQSREIKPVMSAWANKMGCWVPTKPTKPTVSYERTGTNVGTFTVEHTADTEGTQIATYVQYQTCISKSNDKPPSKWSETDHVVNINGLVDVSTTVTKTEQTETISATGLVRWFRARCSGPGGNTAWVYSWHAYSIPNAPALSKASAITNTANSTTTLAATWKTTSSLLRPVDEEIMQYVIGIPTDNACTAPATGWNDAMTVKPSGKGDIVTASVAEVIASDQCMWMRVVSKHDDDYLSYSNIFRVQTARLVAPGISATPNFSTGAVSVTLTINTQCAVARHCIFYRNPKNPTANIPVRILEPGVTTATITIPAIVGASSSCIGAYAFVGSYSGLAVTPIMTSPVAVDEDIAPIAPNALVLEKGTDNTSVFVTLSWRWSAATDLEISWADDINSWNSNIAPRSYIVTDVGARVWVIQDLEVGKKWYFRARYHGLLDDDEIASAWSDVTSIDLATNPDRPTLTLNHGYVLPGGTLSASWNYVNQDESPQDAAQVCLVTVTSNLISYGTVLAHAGSEQNVIVNNTWSTGTQYYLACRVRAASGRYSDWSKPVGVYCPAMPTLTFSNTAIVSNVMTALTGTVGMSVTCDNSTGQYSMYITRARDYHIDRPDDGVYDGYLDETIWTTSGYYGGGSQTYAFTIATEDLIGSLDDGGLYNLVGTITDEYGQTVTQTTQFTVNWAHKSSIAKPTAISDNRLMIVRITPTQPEGYVSGDTFDIYRLTVDQPELIVQNGEYGTTYVDPYPAFGELCGHRVVAKTATGSYISSENVLTWYDLGYSDGDNITCNSLVIDCNGMQIQLPYNIELSNKWQKDFKRTSYLGGSVQGDWNPAILRDLSAKTVIVKNRDTGNLLDLRDLAAYAGPAHIRTPDGSSFSCDIQVSEDASYDDGKVSYNLSVKGIDPEEPDGMTLEEWLALHPVGE